MNQTTVSSCHSLKLIPLALLSRYARLGSCVSMRPVRRAIEAGAVPGTVRVSSTADGGKIKKIISFELSDVSAGTAMWLDALKAMRMVATYVDERGKERVAGSPSCPLALDYTPAEGAFSVTLQGEDVCHDGFLADVESV